MSSYASPPGGTVDLATVVHPVAAGGVFSLLCLIIAIPAASAAILLLGGRSTDRWGHLLGVAAPLASFVIGLWAFFALLVATQTTGRLASTSTWIHASGLRVDFALLFDPLSALFVLLITGVGSLIHIYSIGYMAHDERRRRFFGYLNLFVAAMLVLVLADDYLAVSSAGRASVWRRTCSSASGSTRTPPRSAAKKAFIVNRVGDMGMALAIMLMFATFGTTSFDRRLRRHGQLSTATATAMGLLLLLGACGKSAQVPLQSWLLDAMEGPTPVSALIHAATMVTAGVYLVVRSNFIYQQTAVAQTVVVDRRRVTLLWGAIIGCAKDDIKKALAGSTMSQIGYMMLAAGIGPAGYAFAIFHLLTHGFFKADLFLGAGSVMHAHGRRGGHAALRRRCASAADHVPHVRACGYLAIIGIPRSPASGPRTRSSRRRSARIWSSGSRRALLGAGHHRLLHDPADDHDVPRREALGREIAHPHESPPVMTVPLLVLAAGSAFGGVLLIDNWIGDWLAPVHRADARRTSRCRSRRSR